MRNSSWKHAKHRRYNVIKARRRFNLERAIGILGPSAEFNLSFSKHSIACKCQMCSLDREEGRKDKLRRQTAIADMREHDYELELKQAW